MIVIEHLIQASDVAHTMQHWHIYEKWNERLFAEMSVAFQQGRMGKDPAEGWYKGELGFFDNYIIPLAKKLKECGVFGVSSEEYLNYAKSNRRDWELKGRDMILVFMAEYTANGKRILPSSAHSASTSTFNSSSGSLYKPPSTPWVKPSLNRTSSMSSLKNGSAHSMKPVSMRYLSNLNED